MDHDRAPPSLDAKNAANAPAVFRATESRGAPKYMWWAPCVRAQSRKTQYFTASATTARQQKPIRVLVTSRSHPFCFSRALLATPRPIARAFFARGSARRVARHPRRGSRATARSGGPVGRRAQATGCHELFGTGSAKGRVGSGGAMHAAMRAGVLTAASADRSSAGTRGVLRDARGELRAARRASRREPRAASRRRPSGRLGHARPRHRARARRARARLPARAPRASLSSRGARRTTRARPTRGTPPPGRPRTTTRRRTRKNEEVVGVEAIPGPAGADAARAPLVFRARRQAEPFQ